MLEDHGGRIELKDASDFRPGQRGAWMRLRFSVTGQAAKGETKEQAPQASTEGGETNAPVSGTNEAASTTNDETKIEAATGN